MQNELDYDIFNDAPNRGAVVVLRTSYLDNGQTKHTIFKNDDLHHAKTILSALSSFGYNIRTKYSLIKNVKYDDLANDSAIPYGKHFLLVSDDVVIAFEKLEVTAPGLIYGVHKTSEIKKMAEYKIMNITRMKSAYESSSDDESEDEEENKTEGTNEHKPTGFAKPALVPDKLANFIGVPSGTMLSGPQITKKVWDQLKERKLMLEDKRVFRTNDEVSEVFGVSESVNNYTNHNDKEGFNFCNLQRYISNALKQQK